MSLLHVVTDFVSFVTAFLLKKPSLTHAVVPPFRNRSRSSRLFGCKRPHDGSLSLPTFADSRTGASPVPTVVRNYRLTFLRLAKDCKGSNPINNLQKTKGIANAIPVIYGGEQGTRLTSFAEKFATQTVLL